MGGEIVLIVVLILAAMVMFLLEVLTPTFGLLGALGVTALAVAIWRGFLIHPVLGWALLVSLAVVTPIYLVLLVKRLPDSRLGRWIFLRKARDGTAAGVPEAEGHEALVGKTGTAETQLRPSGAVRIDHRRIIALAESGVIEKDRAVRVVRTEGMNIVVREVKSGD